jgi:hypothetical protein
MIIFELFNLKCIGSCINWKDKKISIRQNIKYLIIALEHYEYNYKYLDKDYKDNTNNINNNLEDFELPFTYFDVSRYWINNITKYNKLFNINFNNMKLNIEYSIAPIYVSRTKNESFIIIGVFLLDYKHEINIINIINDNNEKIKVNSNTFLSTIRSLPLIKKCVSNKSNILLGILNYYNGNNILDDKYLLLNNHNEKYKIPIKTILANACNYLPKIEINIIENKNLQGSFKIR